MGQSKSGHLTSQAIDDSYLHRCMFRRRSDRMLRQNPGSSDECVAEIWKHIFWDATVLRALGSRSQPCHCIERHWCSPTGLFNKCTGTDICFFDIPLKSRWYWRFRRVNLRCSARSATRTKCTVESGGVVFRTLIVQEIAVSWSSQTCCTRRSLPCPVW